MAFHVFGALAEFERSLIQERTLVLSHKGDRTRRVGRRLAHSRAPTALIANRGYDHDKYPRERLPALPCAL